MLPAVTVRVPENPSEMGPAPDAGQLLRIDWAHQKAITFDPASGTTRADPVHDRRIPRGCAARKSELIAEKHFPVVDRGQRTSYRLLAPRSRWAILAVAGPISAVAREHLEIRRRGSLLLQRPATGDPAHERHQDRSEQRREMRCTPSCLSCSCCRRCCALTCGTDRRSR